MMDNILVNTITLGLLLFVLNSEAVDYTKFCVRNPNNTLCIYKDDIPDKLCADYYRKTFTKGEKHGIILWHKQIRENVLRGGETKDGAAGGADRPSRIYWDVTLSAIAQKWADRCSLADDPNRHFGNQTIEQNIFRVKIDKDPSLFRLKDFFRLFRATNDTKQFGRGRWQGRILRKIKSWNAFSIGCGNSIYSFEVRRTNPKGVVEKVYPKMFEMVCNYLPVEDRGKKRKPRVPATEPRGGGKKTRRTKRSRRLEHNPSAKTGMRTLLQKGKNIFYEYENDDDKSDDSGEESDTVPLGWKPAKKGPRPAVKSRTGNIFLDNSKHQKNDSKGAEQKELGNRISEKGDNSAPGDLSQEASEEREKEAVKEDQGEQKGEGVSKLGEAGGKAPEKKLKGEDEGKGKGEGEYEEPSEVKDKGKGYESGNAGGADKNEGRDGYGSGATGEFPAKEKGKGSEVGDPQGTGAKPWPYDVTTEGKESDVGAAEGPGGKTKGWDIEPTPGIDQGKGYDVGEASETGGKEKGEGEEDVKPLTPKEEGEKSYDAPSEAAKGKEDEGSEYKPGVSDKTDFGKEDEEEDVDKPGKKDKGEAADKVMGKDQTTEPAEGGESSTGGEGDAKTVGKGEGADGGTSEPSAKDADKVGDGDEEPGKDKTALGDKDVEKGKGVKVPEKKAKGKDQKLGKGESEEGDKKGSTTPVYDQLTEGGSDVTDEGEGDNKQQGIDKTTESGEITKTAKVTPTVSQEQEGSITKPPKKSSTARPSQLTPDYEGVSEEEEPKVGSGVTKAPKTDSESERTEAAKGKKTEKTEKPESTERGSAAGRPKPSEEPAQGKGSDSAVGKSTTVPIQEQLDSSPSKGKKPEGRDPWGGTTGRPTSDPEEEDSPQNAKVGWGGVVGRPKWAPEEEPLNWKDEVGRPKHPSGQGPPQEVPKTPSGKPVAYKPKFTPEDGGDDRPRTSFAEEDGSGAVGAPKWTPDDKPQPWKDEEHKYERPEGYGSMTGRPKPPPEGAKYPSHQETYGKVDDERWGGMPDKYGGEDVPGGEVEWSRIGRPKWTPGKMAERPKAWDEVAERPKLPPGGVKHVGGRPEEWDMMPERPHMVPPGDVHSRPGRPEEWAAERPVMYPGMVVHGKGGNVAERPEYVDLGPAVKDKLGTGKDHAKGKIGTDKKKGKKYKGKEVKVEKINKYKPGKSLKGKGKSEKGKAKPEEGSLMKGVTDAIDDAYEGSEQEEDNEGYEDDEELKEGVEEDDDDDYEDGDDEDDEDDDEDDDDDEDEDDDVEDDDEDDDEDDEDEDEDDEVGKVGEEKAPGAGHCIPGPGQKCRGGAGDGDKAAKVGKDKGKVKEGDKRKPKTDGESEPRRPKVDGDAKKTKEEDPKKKGLKKEDGGKELRVEEGKDGKKVEMGRGKPGSEDEVAKGKEFKKVEKKKEDEGKFKVEGGDSKDGRKVVKGRGKDIKLEGAVYDVGDFEEADEIDDFPGGVRISKGKGRQDPKGKAARPDKVKEMVPDKVKDVKTDRTKYVKPEKAKERKGLRQDEEKPLGEGISDFDDEDGISYEFDDDEDDIRPGRVKEGKFPVSKDQTEVRKIIPKKYGPVEVEKPSKDCPKGNCRKGPRPGGKNVAGAKGAEDGKFIGAIVYEDDDEDDVDLIDEIIQGAIDEELNRGYSGPGDSGDFSYYQYPMIKGHIDDGDDIDATNEIMELEKEIERQIEAEFGPFKGFLLDDNLDVNYTDYSQDIDDSLKRADLDEFYVRGASVTSKGKFELWALRDYGAGNAIKPDKHMVFAYSIVTAAAYLIKTFLQ